MFEKDMLPVVIIIAIFALLAFDIAANNGAWANTAMDLLQDAWRELRHIIPV